MSAKTDEILESLKSLSLLEASELVKQIEEAFGVSAAASAGVVMAAPGAAAGGGGEAAEEQTEFAADVARKVSGNCDDAALVMGGEDFAFMLEERPGAYILVGNGDSASVHHPEYNFNDEAIPAGCSWWAEIVENRMPAA